MKVLVSAIACNPYLGSENFFGWAAVKCLAQDNELWVLTGDRNRADHARAQKEGLVPDSLHFVYVGKCRPWHPNRLRARMQDWKNYMRFARESLEIAGQLHQREHFDLVHHVTFTTCRVPLPVSRLGVPFILGPVCGNEEFPFRLFPILSPVGAAFEFIRKVSNLAARYSPGVRACVRRAAHVFAITEEAQNLFGSMRGGSTGISRLSPGFYGGERMGEFLRQAAGKNVQGPLRLYAAGNLGGQKCIALALRALYRVKQRGVDFRYHLGASGPELPHLKRLAVQLGLEREIVFGGTMSRQEYQRELHETHIYLLPSMRETVGLTMLEAMLSGCVPIVADNGGPRLAVNESCGYKIPVAAPEQMAGEIAEAILAVDHNRTLILEKGARASAHVAAHYTDEHYRQTVNAVYANLKQAQTETAARRGPRVGPVN